ncbi:MAG: hypothetical protein JW727_03890 [Candidatus Aenigmarchaeota archaeon]|nr:hypothetical protein [Candidatus Aenigmarchaeota archaeon]
MLSGAVSNYLTGVESSYDLSGMSKVGGDYLVESLSRLPPGNLPEVRRVVFGDLGDYCFHGSTVAGDFHTHPLLPFHFRYFSVATEEGFLKVDPLIAANILNCEILPPSGADWRFFLNRGIVGTMCYLGKDVLAVNCLYNEGRNQFSQIPVCRFKDDRLFELPSHVSANHIGSLFDLVEVYRHIEEPVRVSSGRAEFVTESADGLREVERVDEFRTVSKPGTGRIGYMPVARDMQGKPFVSPISEYCAGML